VGRHEAQLSTSKSSWITYATGLKSLSRASACSTAARTTSDLSVPRASATFPIRSHNSSSIRILRSGVPFDMSRILTWGVPTPRNPIRVYLHRGHSPVRWIGWLARSKPLAGGSDAFIAHPVYGTEFTSSPVLAQVQKSQRPGQKTNKDRRANKRYTPCWYSLDELCEPLVRRAARQARSCLSPSPASTPRTREEPMSAVGVGDTAIDGIVDRRAQHEEAVQGATFRWSGRCRMGHRRPHDLPAAPARSMHASCPGSTGARILTSLNG
jgi:hypothetical protein